MDFTELGEFASAFDWLVNDWGSVQYAVPIIVFIGLGILVARNKLWRKFIIIPRPEKRDK